MTAPKPDPSTDRHDAPPGKRRRLRRLARWALAALFALTVLGLVGFKFVLPMWAEPRLRRELSEALGRDVSLAMSTHLFGDTVVLEDVRVAGPAGAGRPLLSAKRASVDIDWLALVGDRSPVRRVELSEIELTAVRNADGSLAVADILKRFEQKAPERTAPAQPTPQPAPAKPQEEKPDYLPRTVALRDVTIRFRDRVRDRRMTWRMDEATLDLTRKDHLVAQWSVPSIAVEGDARATFAGTFQAEIDAAGRLRSFTGDMEATLGDVDLARTYLARQLPDIDLRRGRMSMVVRWVDASGALTLRGRFGAGRLAVARVGRMDNVDVRIESATYNRRQNVGRLTLTGRTTFDKAAPTGPHGALPPLTGGVMTLSLEADSRAASGPNPAGWAYRAVRFREASLSSDALDLEASGHIDSLPPPSILNEPGGMTLRRWLGRIEAADGRLRLSSDDAEVLNAWAAALLPEGAPLPETKRPEIALNLSASGTDGRFSIDGLAEAESVRRGDIRIERPRWSIQRIELTRAGGGSPRWRVDSLGSVSADRWIDMGTGAGVTSFDRVNGGWDLSMTVNETPAALPTIDRLDVRRIGGIFGDLELSVDGHLTNPPMPGADDFDTILRRQTAGDVELALRPSGNRTIDYLRRRGLLPWDDRIDIADDARIVLNVERPAPTPGADRIEGSMTLDGRRFAFNEIELQGDVDGRLAVSWSERDGERRLEIDGRLIGDRLRLPGDGGDPLRTNALRLHGGLSVLRPAEGPSVVTVHQNVDTESIHIAALGNAVGLVESWRRSDRRVKAMLTDPSLYSEATAMLHRLDTAMLPRRKPEALVRRIDAALDDLRQSQGPLCEAIRMALAEHRQSLLTRDRAADGIPAEVSMLRDIEGLFDTRFPSSAAPLFERLATEGTLRGAVRLSKPLDNERLALRTAIDLRDLNTTYAGRPVDTLLTPRRIQTDLFAEAEPPATEIGRIAFDGRLHLTDRPLPEVAWQGQVEPPNERIEVTVTADRLEQLGDIMRRHNLPAPSGSVRLNLNNRSAILRVATTFDRLAFETTRPSRARAHGAPSPRTVTIDGRTLLTVRFDDDRQAAVAFAMDGLRVDAPDREPVILDGAVRLRDLLVEERRRGLTLTFDRLRIGDLRVKPDDRLALNGGLRLTQSRSDEAWRLSLDFRRLAARRGQPLFELGGVTELSVMRSDGAPDPFRMELDRFRVTAPGLETEITVDGGLSADLQSISTDGVDVVAAGAGLSGQLRIDRARVADFVDTGLSTPSGALERIARIAGAAGGSSDDLVRALLETVHVGEEPSLTLRLTAPQLDLRGLHRLASPTQPAPRTPDPAPWAKWRNALRRNLSPETYALLRQRIRQGSAALSERTEASVQVEFDRFRTAEIAASDMVFDIAWRRGVATIRRGRAGTDRGWIDLSGTAVSPPPGGFDIDRPILQFRERPIRVLMSMEARNVPASRGMNRYVDFLFPGLSFEGRYSGRSAMTFNLTPDIEHYRRTGTLALDLAAYQHSLNGSGWSVLTEGTLKGKGAPDYIGDIFPGLTYSTYDFTRMRNHFFVVRGRSRNYMEFAGKTMDIFIHGVTEPDFDVSYIVGLDIGKGLREEFALIPGARFPLLHYKGEIVEGEFEGSVDPVPAHVLLYHLVKSGLVDKTREGVLGGGYIRGAWRVLSWPLRQVTDIRDWAEERANPDDPLAPETPSTETP